MAIGGQSLLTVPPFAAVGATAWQIHASGLKMVLRAGLEQGLHIN